MKFLDKVISVFSPETALKRSVARVKLSMMDESYVSGSSYRPAMLSFNPVLKDADSDLFYSYDKMRARSRDIIRNTSIGSGIIKLMSRGVIGEGLKVMPSIDYKKLNILYEEAKEINSIIESEFNVWSRSYYCDSERISNFYDLQDLAFTSSLENGDVFALLTYVDNPINDYKFTINLIESDFCSTPMEQVDRKGVTYGIKRDNLGAPISYFFKVKERKSENSLSTNLFERNYKYREISAYDNLYRKQVLHIFKKVRISQSRGVPFLSPIIELIKQIERYSEAELMAAVISSKYTVFLKTETGESLAPDSILGETENLRKNDIELGDGTIVELAQGQNVEIANPSRPNSQYEPFILSAIKKIGMGLGIPFEVLMQSFNASYSASQGSLMEAEKTYVKYRNEFISKFCEPIYERFMDELVSLKKINAPGYFEDPIIRNAYLSCYWLAPKKGMIDELKEIRAAEARINLGISNKTIEARRLSGVKWESIVETRKREIEIEKEIEKEQIG